MNIDQIIVKKDYSGQSVDNLCDSIEYTFVLLPMLRELDLWVSGITDKDDHFLIDVDTE